MVKFLRKRPKPIRIEFLKKMLYQLKSETLKEPVMEIEIEPEIIDMAQYIHETTKNRTRKDITSKLGEAGWLGQELFNGIMLQHKIPSLYANPIYEEQDIFRKILGKHFDFHVPLLGTLSVKTTPEGPSKTRFMANVGQWQNEIHDISVAIKIESLKDRKAWLYGWLYEWEVERLPIHDFGQGDAYWTYLDHEKVETNKHDDGPAYQCSSKLLHLHPASTLMENLIVVRDAFKEFEPVFKKMFRRLYA